METKFLINKIIEDMKGYFKNNGLPNKVVIGISGGKDSSVVAALATKAFGSENVIGVEMPNGTQTDIADSDALIEFLKIQKRVMNIGSMYEELCKICRIHRFPRGKSRGAVFQGHRDCGSYRPSQGV